MKPRAFFEVGRNEPCPCGGGDKYKRCCLDRVEATRRALATRVGPPAGSPALADLVRGLALACALPPDRDLDEEPADQERVSAALRAVLAATQEEEVGPVRELHERLEFLLREDRGLRALRFWPTEAQEAFEAASRDGLPDAADAAAVDRFMGKVLASLVNQDLADDAAWELVSALRAPGRTDDDLRALVWGLLNAVLTFHAPLGANLLWRSVLHLTMEDMDGFLALAQALVPAQPVEGDAGATAGHAGPPPCGSTVAPAASADAVLAASAEGGEPRPTEDDLIRYLQEHPVIDRLLSRDYYERVAPALDAIHAGTVPVDVPPYALAFTLHDLWSVLAPAVAAMLRDAAPARAGGVPLPGGGALIDLPHAEIRPVIRTAWEHDYPLFVPAVREALEAWLARQGGTADPGLAAAVRHLAATFGDGLLEAHWHAFEIVVLVALNSLFRENPPLTPPAARAGEGAPAQAREAAAAGPDPASGDAAPDTGRDAPGNAGPERLLDLFLAPDAAERYAAALEAAGLTEAAAHVRAAARGVAPGSAQPAEPEEGG